MFSYLRKSCRDGARFENREGGNCPLIPTALLCSLNSLHSLVNKLPTYSVNQDLISSYNRRRKIKGTVFTYIIIKDSGMIRFDLIRRLLRKNFFIVSLTYTKFL